MGVIPSEEDRKLAATRAGSFSSYNLWSQCKLKYYYHYIRGFKAPPETFFATGTICHHVAEWSGDWCYKTLFANKFGVYYKKHFEGLSDETAAQIAEYLKKASEDVTPHDFGVFLYENPIKIRDYGFKSDKIVAKGLSSMVKLMDVNILEDEYEKPSMPDRDTYEKMIQTAINKEKCVDFKGESEIGK